MRFNTIYKSFGSGILFGPPCMSEYVAVQYCAIIQHRTAADIFGPNFRTVCGNNITFAAINVYRLPGRHAVPWLMADTKKLMNQLRCRSTCDYSGQMSHWHPPTFNAGLLTLNTLATLSNNSRISHRHRAVVYVRYESDIAMNCNCF